MLRNPFGKFCGIGLRQWNAAVGNSAVRVGVTNVVIPKETTPNLSEPEFLTQVQQNLNDVDRKPNNRHNK